MNDEKIKYRLSLNACADYNLWNYDPNIKYRKYYDNSAYYAERRNKSFRRKIYNVLTLRNK